MQSLCDRALRCLCSCLIKKDPLNYSLPSDEQNKFITLNDHLDDDHRLGHPAKADPDISGKLKTYLEAAADTQPPHSKQPTLPDTFALKSEHSHDDEQKLLKQQPSARDYSDVMSESHPYYHLFKEKLTRLANVFQVPAEGNNEYQPATDYRLRLYCYPQGKTNIFVYFFKFPTDLETYESISSDFQLQRKFDSNIDQYRKELEVIGQNTKVIYLAYKKILIVSARDFYYVKHTFNKYHEHWTICTTDPSYNEHEGKVRGEMLLTATRIVEVADGIEISVYSQIDMKIPIRTELAKNRGYAEIKKYLDKVYSYVGTYRKREQEFDI